MGSLAALVEAWSQRIETLAADFAAGRAAVVAPAACRSCHLHGCAGFPRRECRRARGRRGRADRPPRPTRRPASEPSRRRARYWCRRPQAPARPRLLAQRYLRLLALVDAPERILALTFTRRAAQEMRERVLLALDAARRERCPEHMNRETWNLAKLARRHLDALHLDIERQPSRLRIETIDAFNAWLASQLPISAGAGAASQVSRRCDAVLRGGGAAALWRTKERISSALPSTGCWPSTISAGVSSWRSSPTCCRAATAGCRCWRDRLRAASALDEAQLHRVRAALR